LNLKENEKIGEKMGSRKSSNLKKTLGKKLKQNRRVPIFILAKTKRKANNPKVRNWLRKKIDIKID